MQRIASRGGGVHHKDVWPAHRPSTRAFGWPAEGSRRVESATTGLSRVDLLRQTRTLKLSECPCVASARALFLLPDPRKSPQVVESPNARGRLVLGACGREARPRIGWCCVMLADKPLPWLSPTLDMEWTQRWHRICSRLRGTWTTAPMQLLLRVFCARPCSSKPNRAARAWRLMIAP